MRLPGMCVKMSHDLLSDYLETNFQYHNCWLVTKIGFLQQEEGLLGKNARWPKRALKQNQVHNIRPNKRSITNLVTYALPLRNQNTTILL